MEGDFAQAEEHTVGTARDLFDGEFDDGSHRLGVEQDKEPGDTVGQTDLVVVQQVTREFPTVIGVEGRGVVGGFSAAGDLYALDMAVACCPLEECAEAV